MFYGYGFDNFDNNKEDFDPEIPGYNAEPTETNPKPASSNGFLSILKEIQYLYAPYQGELAPIPVEKTSTAPATPAPNRFYESNPVYKGHYTNLCPLTFDTASADNFDETKLSWVITRTCNQTQLFFLLRLERLLRLRKYWLNAQPLQHEAWKTNLIVRSIYSTLCVCQNTGIGEEGLYLIKAWKIQ
jgi:hypothetical protein